MSDLRYTSGIYPDAIGDVFSSILPGIVFAITLLLNSKYIYPKNEEEGRKMDRVEKIKKVLFTLIPVTFMIVWYSIKKIILKRDQKIGNLLYILIANIFSFMLIVISGMIVLIINNYTKF